MKKMKSALIVMSATVILFSACKKSSHSSNPSGSYFGTPVSVGNGKARSFVLLDDNGVPSSFGLRFSEDALNGLPADTMPGMPGIMIRADVPDIAKTAGLDHIIINWNPLGHEPAPIYGVPHFDFHFYYVTDAVQNAIAGGPDMIPVNPQYIPKDYHSAVVAVPGMGVHWLDSLSTEFHRIPFTATFIYGFYKGDMMFVEPMITKAFLSGHPDFSAPVKQPAAFQKSGYYPLSYKVQFDNVNHEYVITLAGLTKH
ncbi:MAG: DUF5602 domain-containing protein [Bacteroidota bacterium]|nr:DUF5602 domain-containing protein [Bacteroidota bacterium]